MRKKRREEREALRKEWMLLEVKSIEKFMEQLNGGEKRHEK